MNEKVQVMLIQSEHTSLYHITFYNSIIDCPLLLSIKTITYFYGTFTNATQKQ